VERVKHEFVAVCFVLPGECSQLIIKSLDLWSGPGLCCIDFHAVIWGSVKGF